MEKELLQHNDSILSNFDTNQTVEDTLRILYNKGSESVYYLFMPQK